MLKPEQCFRLVKPVDIEAAVAVLPRLQFVGVNQGGTDTSRYPCFVVLHDKFPPELTALVEGLGLGGTCARAILRKLMPRQCIPPHVDAWMPSELNWSRYQLPIVTDPAIRMWWPDDGLGEHLKAGMLYEVRYDRMHEVTNYADVERVHLQIDQIDATI
jgi:hypothetical protein